MKILHFSGYYYPFVGGIEQVSRAFVNAVGSEHEQRVICFNHVKGDAVDEMDGVTVTRAGCYAKISSQQLSRSFYKLLKREFLSFEPDLVVFHYPNPFAAHYILKLLKKRPQCKLVLYWHLDITKQKILGKLLRGQSKRLCARADVVIGATVVHLSESAFYPYFQGKDRILPYCIDESSLQLTAEDTALSQVIREKYAGRTICFAMGRHVPYKGMEYLIRAAKTLDADKFVFLIAGQGPLTESLKKLAQDCPNIEFLGLIDAGARRAYLNACDIFCFPSVTRNEGFGLALAEAMYFGKPAVTFHIPGSGVNYVSLNAVTGVEVENCNVEKYAAAIGMLAKDRGLRNRLGEAARERVLERYTQERFRENIRLLLKDLENTNGEST